MAPNLTNAAAVTTGVLNEDDPEVLDSPHHEAVEQLKVPKSRQLQLVWRNIILFAYLHMAALYGVYLIFTSAKILTTVFSIILYQMGVMGITAGAHRLWAHKSYKVRWPLEVILIIFNTLAFQDAAMHWARDHRVHHKFSETDADPHNAKRGFFFSHIGWLLCKKHPDVKEKGKCIDISDLKKNPVLIFQKKYYMILMPLTCFILPTLVPWYFWNETLNNSWFVATLWRYTLTLNVIWLVNSAAHMWGNRPYDQTINPSETRTVTILSLGEGWHNYHHVFPWDYRAAEIGHFKFNFSTMFINFFARIGWAYDLKTVSDEVIRKRVNRTGDGSHHIWGWGDPQHTSEDKKHAVHLYSSSKKAT